MKTTSEMNRLVGNSWNIKCEKFSKNFSKQTSLESNKEITTLEKRVKDFERDMQNFDHNHEYLTCKNKLEAIYNNILFNSNIIFNNNVFPKFFKNIEQLKVELVQFFIITR